MFPSLLAKKIEFTDKSSLVIFLKLTFMLLHKNNLPEHCSFKVVIFCNFLNRKINWQLQYEYSIQRVVDMFVKEIERL